MFWLFFPIIFIVLFAIIAGMLASPGEGVEDAIDGAIGGAMVGVILSLVFSMLVDTLTPADALYATYDLVEVTESGKYVDLDNRQFGYRADGLEVLSLYDAEVIESDRNEVEVYRDTRSFWDIGWSSDRYRVYVSDDKVGF